MRIVNVLINRNEIKPIKMRPNELNVTCIIKMRPNHIAVKAYQVPTCTGPRSPILLRLVCGRTPVATLGMWADPGRALSVGSGAKRRVGSDTGKHTRKNYCNHE